MARAVFPEASILMLEAQENKHPILESLKMASYGKIDYRIAVMGPNDGEKVVFHEYENSPTASSMLQDNAATPSRKVDALQRTLDSILSTNQFPKPDLIKLDVQGFEIEVLKGAANALSNTEAVLMEVSIIELYQNSPILHEITAFMADRGFRTYDICSLLHRPLDGALCQIDIIFLKESSKLLNQKIWG
jgi:FkbM family methyltransferase